jgi:hypothetical protein
MFCRGVGSPHIVAGDDIRIDAVYIPVNQNELDIVFREISEIWASDACRRDDDAVNLAFLQ